VASTGIAQAQAWIPDCWAAPGLAGLQQQQAASADACSQHDRAQSRLGGFARTRGNGCDAQANQASDAWAGATMVEAVMSPQSNARNNLRLLFISEHRMN
jgi:hypothetical protein